ncbi:hypothetical protein PIROE2DRAFT_1536 [Piromyces sp. E2]|nr:hypothetical protein PIROE2DRAFT_1536 [Piromyces sp. E2]|eukprot:OUM70379.1 hypothetical protein PIROE2DRAFT_1536 [Piromyces sp. E2]
MSHSDGCCRLKKISEQPLVIRTTHGVGNSGSGGASPKLTDCTKASGADDPCFENAPVNSVCISGNSLLITTSSKKCKSLSSATDVVHFFDENGMELTGKVNPNDVKYTYVCGEDNTITRRATDSDDLPDCAPLSQHKGGVILRSAVGATARPAKLPECIRDASETNVCSGVVEAANDGTHCVRGRKIYKNTVHGSSGSCALVVGDLANDKEYFAFDAQGKRLDKAGVLAGAVANSVSSTYICTDAGSKAISDCQLTGNQIPDCTSEGKVVGSACLDNGAVMIVTDAQGAKASINGSCGADAKYYFNEDFKPVAGDVPSAIKYAYICGSANSADCTPVYVNTVGEVDVGGNVPMVCTSDSDADAVGVGDSTVRYTGFTVDAPADFPGTVGGKLDIHVKVTKEKSIVKVAYGGAGLGQCDNANNDVGGCQVSSANVGACVADKSSYKISVTTARPKCKALTGTGGTSKYYYFNQASVEQSTIDANTQISYAYKCSFGGSGESQALSRCDPVTGYTIQGSYGVVCSGLEGEACTVHTLSTCTSTDEGKLGRNGQRIFVCFGRTAVDLPTDATTVSVAFLVKEFNAYYGTYGITFLRLTKDTVTVDTGSIAKGYHVNPNTTGLKNALIYCTGTGQSTCSVMDAVAGYYQSALGKEYVVRCDATNGCKATKLDPITCGFDTLLPTCTGTEATAKCIAEAAVDSHCISHGVVYKNGDATCTAVTASTTTTPQKFYFDRAYRTTGTGTSYYLCEVSAEKTLSNCTPERTKLPDCTGGVSATAKCYDGGVDQSHCLASNNALLKNSGSSCVAVTGKANDVLYFGTDGRTATGSSYLTTAKLVYKCTTGGSSTPSALSNCRPIAQDIGGVIKSSEGVKLCVSAEDTKALKLDTTTSAYEKVSVEANIFPGVAQAGTYTVKVTGNGYLGEGVVEVREEASLPTCTNAGSNTEKCKVGTVYADHCVKGDVVYESRTGKCAKLSPTLPACDAAPLTVSACMSGGKAVAYCQVDGTIYRSNGNQCVALDVDHELEQVSYYDKDYVAVDPADAVVSYAYQCWFSAGGVATACQFAKGITKTSNRVVACNGWKNDVCTVTEFGSATACSNSAVEGSVRGGASGLCIGGVEEAFPVSGFKYVAFTTAKMNSLYGVEKGEIVLLKMTANSALVTAYTGRETVVMMDKANKVNDDGRTPLVRCSYDIDTSSHCEAMASGTVDKETGEAGAVVKAGIPHTYYVDGAYPNGEQLITCTQGSRDAQKALTSGTCATAAPTLTYYVDSGVEGHLITCGSEARVLGYGRLPTCERTVGGKDCIAGAAAGSLCVRNGLLYKTVSASSCVAVKTCASAVSPYGLYYTGSGSGEKEKVIRCDWDDDREAVACAYYEDVNTATECVDGDGNADNEGRIGFVVGSTHFKQCHNGVARDVNDAHAGYVWMDGERAQSVFAGARDAMLVENKGTSLVQVRVRDGYYVNEEDPDGKIIKCTESDGCAVVEVHDKYCIGGADTKLPVCTDIRGTEKCVAEASENTHCIRDGRLYKTVAGEEKCKLVGAMEPCTSTEPEAACISGASSCMSGGKAYISLDSKCVEADTVTTTCEQVEAGSKCVATAEDGDLCRQGNKIYQSGTADCTLKTTLLEASGRITLYFDASFAKTDSIASAESVYQCQQKRGVLANCVRSNLLPGELVYSGTQFSVCRDKVGTTELITNAEPTNPYRSIRTEMVDAFPGAYLPDRHVLRMGANWAVLVKDRKSLPECDAIVNGRACQSNENAVPHCLLNDAIYASDDHNCVKLEGPARTTVFYYFDEAGERIDEGSLDLSSPVDQVYKCRYDENRQAKRCSVMKGFVVVNGVVVVNCNGWGACTLTPTNALANTCVDGKEGQWMGNGRAICIPGRDGEMLVEYLPTDTSTRYLMFQAGTTNPYLGQYEGDAVLLALTARSATVVDGGEEVKRGYYQNIRVSGSLTGALIFCGEAGRVDGCHVVNGLNGYYLSNDSDNTTHPVIRCEKYLGCWKQEAESTCKGAGAIVKTGGKVYVCVNASGTKVEVNAAATEANYKSVAAVSASFPGAIEENESVVKVGTDGSVVLLEDGIHLNDNVRGGVDQAVYACATEGVKTTCTRQYAGFGYYRNAGTVGYQDQYLACDVNGCTRIFVDVNAVCGVDSVGQLVGSTPDLCLNYDSVMEKAVTAGLAEASSGDYMVAYNRSNVFGIGEDHYAYVAIDSESVLLNNNVNKKYVYTAGQKENTGTACPTDVNDLYEFLYVDNGIYELVCNDEDTGDLCK